MKSTSTNGTHLEIKPKRWYSLNDWLWVFEHVEICNNQDFPKDVNHWDFTNGTITRI